MSGHSYEYEGEEADPYASAAPDSSENNTHTQFLDLTFGEGGELSPPTGQPQSVGTGSPADASAVATAAAAAAAHNNLGDDDGVGGMDVDAMLRLSAEMEPPMDKGKMDKKTPGHLVEPGHEHTGRWTKEEHDAFLAALQMYGKEWKKVAAKVKTRTVVQTRTHAQKYFQKLQKTVEGGESSTTIMRVTASETKPPKKVPPSRKKKQKRTPKAAPAMSKATRRSSSATMSAAQVISTLSNAKPSFFAPAPNGSMDDPVPPRHGFSMPEPAAAGGNINSNSPFHTGGGWNTGSHMKIQAPDPGSQRGKFPEPSPAATGKRKLAEIAAARMLAGVGSAFANANSAMMDDNDGPPTPPPSANSGRGGGRLNLKDAPLPPLFGGGGFATKTAGTGSLSLQIVNPSSLGISHNDRSSAGGDSPVTPWDGQLEALVGAASSEDDDKKVPSIPEDGGSGAVDVSAQIRAIVTGSQVAKIHPVNGPATAYRRSALHQAVCQQDWAKLQSQLEAAVIASNSSDEATALQKLDDAGFGPLHSACALHLADPIGAQDPSTTTATSTTPPNEIVRMLLAAKADPALEDGKGNTPLHWAARAGDKDAVEQLVHQNAPLDAKNAVGETPLHWAMRSGMRGARVVAVLLENGSRPNILDKTFRRPIDVAFEGFLDDESSLASLRRRESQGYRVSKELKKILKLSAADRRDARANFLIRSAHSRTLVLHHPECLEHHPKSEADWEAPDRVRTIMRRVLPSSDPAGVTETSGIFPYEVTVSQEFDRASLDLLSRVHSTEYLSFVNKLSKDLEKKLKEGGCSIENSEHGSVGSPPPVVPFTPMVQRSMIKIDESSVKLGVNSDTSFSAGSLRAARRAAGAVQHAVDCVLVGRNRNAFCVVRPPGHHAGINGLLEGGESCGFCIFNNVAAGALHAISDDKLLCNKCAIVDIDVHHGNGTEEVVRKCHDPSKMFFFSIHLYDNDKKKRGGNGGGNQNAYQFYPGTGAEDDLALNIINVPIVPLWKDPGGGRGGGGGVAPPIPARTHNTRNKVREAGGGGEDESASDMSAAARMPSTSDAGSEAGSSTMPSSQPNNNNNNSSAAFSSSGRQAYRQAIQNRLLPALRAFSPDLILISAGFDAAKGDVGNARHERGRERIGLDLEPEDYAWTTRKILEIADICCQGRVVSVLEGGYGRTAPTTVPTSDAAAAVGPESVPAAPDEHQLDRTVFGECAVRHLHAMIDPYNAENRFSSS